MREFTVVMKAAARTRRVRNTRQSRRWTVALGVVVLLATFGSRATAQQAASDATPQAGAAPAQASGSYEGYLPEPRLLSKAINRAVDRFGEESGRTKSGFFIETSNMLTGSGWISAGPGYRQLLFNQRAVVETSGAISWRFYKMVQGRFEFSDLGKRHLALGTQVMWRDQTQVQYFGLGPDTDEDLRSQYRIKTTDLVGYARVRPRTWLTLGADLGWLRRPTLHETAGWFKRDIPEAAEIFPFDPGIGENVQPNFLHGGVAVTADTRDYRSHPTRGGLYRAAWMTFRDQDQGVFTFDRYEFEAAHFIPVSGPRWVLAFHGWTALTDGGEVPVYLMPSLGGGNTIRSVSDYRFHERHMVVMNAESRWAVFSHVDVAAFFDAGSVARRAADLNFDKTAYGIGVRLHTQRSTLGRVDIARGDGGWKFLFRTSDPLHLTRLSRRVAPVPFAP